MAKHPGVKTDPLKDAVRETITEMVNSELFGENLITAVRSRLNREFEVVTIEVHDITRGEDMIRITFTGGGPARFFRVKVSEVM